MSIARSTIAGSPSVAGVDGRSIRDIGNADNTAERCNSQKSSCQPEFATPATPNFSASNPWCEMLQSSKNVGDRALRCDGGGYAGFKDNGRNRHQTLSSASSMGVGPSRGDTQVAWRSGPVFCNVGPPHWDISETAATCIKSLLRYTKVHVDKGEPFEVVRTRAVKAFREHPPLQPTRAMGVAASVDIFEALPAAYVLEMLR